MKEKLYSIKKNSGRSDAWKSFEISKRTLLIIRKNDNGRTPASIELAHSLAKV